MPRLVLLTGTILLMADYAFAQYTPDPMQCQQIRQAAAQYGYAASRQHALETYGPEAVKAGLSRPYFAIPSMAEAPALARRAATQRQCRRVV